MSESEVKIEGYTHEKLYELLPATYRQRDAKIGKPLEDLIGIIAKYAAMLEKDIGGLYDNWFIETCDEWVTSYIADLVGAQSLSASKSSSLSTPQKVTQRAYVANTIAYRRRKGTLSMLEQLARDITQWGARAEELFHLLETTQNINHLRLANIRTPDLRDTSSLEMLNTPFDTIAHTVEVRRIASNRGLYNIQNIGLFLWRLQAFPSRDTHAFPYLTTQDKETTFKFKFDPFGYDSPLFNLPDTESSISHIAEEFNLPLPIRRRALYDALENYYGKDLSIFVSVKYDGETDYRDIPARDIAVCNLHDWTKPAAGKVAIDPETGRISLAENAQAVKVSYYYGFSSTIGGGFYKRSELSYATTPTVYKISKNAQEGGSGIVYASIDQAIDAWAEKRDRNVLFEITDSEIYDEVLRVSLPVNCKAAIAASEEQRPILRSLRVQGESGSSLTLDGLWFYNPSDAPTIKVMPGDMDSLSIRHCTLVPGRNTYKRKVAVGMKSYARRYLCTWDNITHKNQAKRLRNFLKRNFASWITEEAVFEKVDAESLVIKVGEKSITIRLESSSSKESVAYLDINEDGTIQKNVYEFILLTEDGKMNLYLKGGNDDLQLSLDHSIIGRVQILDSLIFTWDRIQAEEDDNRFLRAFLKANFYLPWLNKDTPFENKMTNPLNDGSVISAEKDSEHKLTITLKGSKAVLNINGEDVYEFVAREKWVYTESDANLIVTDSIIDGKGKNEAIESRSATIQNTTVFGKTRVDKLKLASNVIFTGPVQSTVTQEGCARFSYISPGSKTPRRYMCQPKNESKDDSVRPSFTSETYGDPGYAQLHRSISDKIFKGADNGAEMGVFNHLFQPQRIADLKLGLDEYLRVGLEAGVFLVT